MLRKKYLALIAVGGLVHLGLVVWGVHRLVYGPPAASSSSEMVDETIFTGLAAYHAPDFPTTAERLERCRVDEDRECLDLYDQVQTARARLFADGREAALDRTLLALDTLCDPAAFNSGKDDGEACSGVSVALWYFDDAHSDGVIRGFLEPREPQLFGLYEASGGRPWASNRPDGAAWVTLFESSGLDGELSDGDTDTDSDDTATLTADDDDDDAPPADTIAVDTIDSDDAPVVAPALDDDDSADTATSDDDGDSTSLLSVDVAPDDDSADQVTSDEPSGSWADFLDELVAPQHGDEAPTHILSAR